jgi:hypothetical protein
MFGGKRPADARGPNNIVEGGPGSGTAGRGAAPPEMLCALTAAGDGSVWSCQRCGMTLTASDSSFDCEDTMAYTLAPEVWSATGFARGQDDRDPLDAIRGIMMGTLLSVLAFWMPLAIALTR